MLNLFMSDLKNNREATVVTKTQAHSTTQGRIKMQYIHVIACSCRGALRLHNPAVRLTNAVKQVQETLQDCTVISGTQADDDTAFS